MLTLKTKSVRFEWADADVESVVTLSSDDDQGTLLRKLKRVIALVEGEQAPPMGMAKADAATGGLNYVDAAPPQTGNGWAAFAPPEIPEGADYELIPPGEGE